MSDLQLALLAIGAVVVAGVYGYNVWQQRRLRLRTEQAFRENKPGDALFAGGAPAASVVERIEPTLAPGETPPPPPGAAVEPAANSGEQPDADVECVAEIQLAAPAPADALAPAYARRAELGKPLRWFGLDAASGRWMELQQGAGGSFSAFRGALQLADRSGPASTVALGQFRDLVNNLARELGAEAQCPEPEAEQARAARLDAFCAEVDVMMVVNAVSRDGAAFPGTKVRALAEAAGFKLEKDGVFRFRDEEGIHLFSLCNQEEAPFYPDAVKSMSTRGLTFFLEVPRVQSGEYAFDRMVTIARGFCGTLGAMLVDDNRVPLNDPGIERIRAQLRALGNRMEIQGVAPGGPRALRLFS
jgi:FtsZ-interacting cell division protein ZipA